VPTTALRDLGWIHLDGKGLSDSAWYSPDGKWVIKRMYTAVCTKVPRTMRAFAVPTLYNRAHFQLQPRVELPKNIREGRLIQHYIWSMLREQAAEHQWLVANPLLGTPWGDDPYGKIADIHTENVGYYNGRPVFFDW